MKIVERILERRIRPIVDLNEMQFGFMPEKVLWMLYILREDCKNIYRRIKSCICTS